MQTLREQRIDAGLTQFDVAERTGISRGTYGAWECGQRRVSTIGRKTLQGVMGWSVDVIQPRTRTTAHRAHLGQRGAKARASEPRRMRIAQQYLDGRQYFGALLLLCCAPAELTDELLSLPVDNWQDAVIRYKQQGGRVL